MLESPVVNKTHALGNHINRIFAIPALQQVLNAATLSQRPTSATHRTLPVANRTCRLSQDSCRVSVLR